MTRILVTGATGMLGASVIPWLKHCGHTVLRHGFRGGADYQADLRDHASTAALLDQTRPECVINLAALTDVDLCERHPDAAYRLNVACVDHLCRWIRNNGTNTHLVQISTDQVYDGMGPHRESAVTVSNTYAFSKIAAEPLAVNVLGTVLRTNFFGRSRCPGRSSFSDWVHESIRGEQPLALFEDVLFSPLSLATVSDMVERVVRQRPHGIFNLGAADGLSKADFAHAFAETLALPTAQLRRVRSDGAGLSAYRPKDMRMNSSLFERSLGVRLPAVRDELLAIRSDYAQLP